MLIPLWERRFHSVFSRQHCKLLSKRAYSCSSWRFLGQSLWEKSRCSIDPEFLCFFYSNRVLQKARQAAYSSGLCVKVTSLNIDWVRMWVLFKLTHVCCRGMLVCLKRLGHWLACFLLCLIVDLCIDFWAVSLTMLSSLFIFSDSYWRMVCLVGHCAISSLTTVGHIGRS